MTDGSSQALLLAQMGFHIGLVSIVQELLETEHYQRGTFQERWFWKYSGALWDVFVCFQQSKESISLTSVTASPQQKQSGRDTKRVNDVTLYLLISPIKLASQDLNAYCRFTIAEIRRNTKSMFAIL